MSDFKIVTGIIGNLVLLNSVFPRAKEFIRNLGSQSVPRGAYTVTCPGRPHVSGRHCGG